MHGAYEQMQDRQVDFAASQLSMIMTRDTPIRPQNKTCLTAALVMSCHRMKKHYPLTMVLVCCLCLLGLTVKLSAADKSNEKATAGTDLRPLVASKKLVQG